MELWHNPRCSKSRAAKEILDSREVAYTERRYLEDPPAPATLDRVLHALGKEPWEIARLGEDRARELGLPDRAERARQGEPGARDRAEWIAVLVANPILIERPILVADDGRAVVGRPPEAVEELI